MATPLAIEANFIDNNGDPIEDLDVYVKLNGPVMFLTDGTQVSTQEEAYTTDSSGQVMLSMYCADDFDLTTSTSLTDPASYIIRIPKYNIRRCVSVPDGATGIAELTELDDIE